MLPVSSSQMGEKMAKTKISAKCDLFCHFPRQQIEFSFFKKQLSHRGNIFFKQSWYFLWQINYRSIAIQTTQWAGFGKNLLKRCFQEQRGCCGTLGNVNGICKSISAPGGRLVEGWLGAPRSKEMEAEMLHFCCLVRKGNHVMTMMQMFLISLQYSAQLEDEKKLQIVLGYFCSKGKTNRLKKKKTQKTFFFSCLSALFLLSWKAVTCLLSMKPNTLGSSNKSGRQRTAAQKSWRRPFLQI